jgi:prevent-host-death family protein
MSKAYGIEEARKILGDLVTAAQHGRTTVITRNGRPAAHLTPVPVKETPMTYQAQTTATGTAPNGEAAEVTLTCTCKRHRTPEATAKCLAQQRQDITGYDIKATSVTAVALASDGTRVAF